MVSTAELTPVEDGSGVRWLVRSGKFDDGVLRVVGKKMVWAALTGERATARASRMLRRNSGELRGLDPRLHKNEQRGGLRVRQDTGKELG